MRKIDSPSLLEAGVLPSEDLYETFLVPMDPEEDGAASRGVVFPASAKNLYPTLWPVSIVDKAFWNVSSEFSGNRHRSSKAGRHVHRPHKGIDLALPKGTRVFAAGTGPLLFRGWSKTFGNWAVLGHPQDIISVYCHLASPVTLPVNKQVQRGTILGYSGNTGQDFDGSPLPPHLHFEIRVSRVRGQYQLPPSGLAVNPREWLVDSAKI